MLFNKISNSVVQPTTASAVSASNLAIVEQILRLTSDMVDEQDRINYRLKKTNGLYNKAKLFLKTRADLSKNYLKTQEDEYMLGKKIQRLDEVRNKFVNSNLKTSKAIVKNIEKQLIEQKTLLALKKVEQDALVENFSNYKRLNEMYRSFLNNYDSYMSSINMSMSIFKGSFKLIGAYLDLVFSPFKKGFQFFLDFQKTSGNLAADLGLSAKESKTLKNQMYDSFISATLLGGKLEDVATVINSFSESLGKNRIFSPDELKNIIELGLGTKLGVQGATELVAEFSKVGYSLNDIIKSTGKIRDSAAKLNLNSTKLLATYQGLFKSFIGFDMSRNLKAFGELANKATSLRLDLSGASALADKLFDPEGAVEAAAKIGVLGGKFSQMFSDPFNLMYAAQNAPQELYENMIKATQGMARKGADGSFFVTPADRKIITEFATSLGIDGKNLIEVAIEQAKVTDKMAALAGKGINMFGVNDEDRLAISNLIELRDGNYTIKMSDGSTKLLSQITSKSEFDKILKERKANEDAAIGRQNMLERLGLVADRFLAAFSKSFDKLFGGSKFDTFLKGVDKIGVTFGNLVSSLLSKDGEIYSTFDAMINSANGLFSTLDVIFKDPTKSFGQKIGDGFIALVRQMKDPIMSVIGMAVKTLVPLIKIPIIETLRLLENIPVVGGLFGGARRGLERSVVKTQVGNMIYGDQSLNPLGFGEAALQNSTSLGLNALTGLYKNAGKIASSTLPEKLLKSGAMSGAKILGKNVLKFIPGIGLVVSGYEAMDNFSKGNYVRGGLNLVSGAASFIPGIGTAVSLGTDLTATGIDIAESMSNPEKVNDLIISKHGAFKADKGDLVMALHEDGFKKSTKEESSVMKVEHSGVITLQSTDGKSITIDMLEANKLNIMAWIASNMKGINTGSITHTQNELPVAPL